MLLGQELKFKNKLCNLKLGTFFSALPGLRASALSGRAASMSFCLLPMFRPVTIGSGRAASMSFCPLPLLYPSANDFQFRYAPVTVGSGRAASRSFWACGAKHAKVQ